MVHTPSTTVSSTRLSRWSAAVRPLTWQAAVMAYRQAELTKRDRLSQNLASRVLGISDQYVDASSISVDPKMRTATVTVGGLVFQLREAALLLVRPCAHCGVGRFTSAPIACAVDLGHALSRWEPCCAGCVLNGEDEDWSHSF